MNKEFWRELAVRRHGSNFLPLGNSSLFIFPFMPQLPQLQFLYVFTHINKVPIPFLFSYQCSMATRSS
jgi:hypothetical protein